MSAFTSAVTSHVLDTATGRPAAGLPVRLERVDDSGDECLAGATTDDDGRVRALGPETLASGVYRLVFDTGAYFSAAGVPAFYPQVAVTFTIDADGGHYHVPLLLSPYGYSTYRGS